MLVVALAACTTPLKQTDKASLNRIAVVPVQNARWLHYYETGPSLPIAAGMGAQAAQFARFEKVFKPHAPDVPKLLTEVIIESLRARGYTVVSNAADGDAVLSLNLRSAGYGPAYESKAFVPQIHLLVTMTRTRDQQSIYREVFAYGGGMFGSSLTKFPHDRHLEFATAKDVLSQPEVAAQRLVEAVRLFGPRTTAGFSK